VLVPLFIVGRHQVSAVGFGLARTRTAGHLLVRQWALILTILSSLSAIRQRRRAHRPQSQAEQTGQRRAGVSVDRTDYPPRQTVRSSSNNQRASNVPATSLPPGLILLLVLNPEKTGK
jgi:hypothetical protein